MQLHQIKPKNAKMKKKRVGRGGKKGTYCGKGMKGQKSRAGRRFRPDIRELVKRYPKLRGYRFHSNAKPVFSFNLDVLEKNFEAESKVNPQSLLENKIIRKIKGRVPQVKILGTGELKKSLFVEGCLLSKSAKEKIEKAGGKAGTVE